MKKGDKVRCIKTSPAGYFGVVGQEYTLAEDQSTHQELLLVEDSQQQWLSGDRFELVTTHTNAFKVGDHVKVLDSYSGMYAGMEGNITKIDPFLQGSVRIKFDNGIEWNFNNHDVEHVKASSFNVGDEVYYIGQDPSYQAIIGFVLSKGIHTASVIFHSIGSRVVLFKNDELVKRVNLATPVNPQTQTIRTGFGTISIGGLASGGSGTYTAGLNAVAAATLQTASSFTSGAAGTVGIVGKNIGCSHKWQFYMGLNERFEFCTTCNEKRDTDRRV